MIEQHLIYYLLLDVFTASGIKDFFGFFLKDAKHTQNLLLSTIVTKALYSNGSNTLTVNENGCFYCILRMSSVNIL